MDRLRIGIVGANFGRHIAEVELASSPAAALFEVVAVCDQDRGRAEAVAGAAGVTACTDLADLLSDPSVDVVGLFTGPAGRAELVRRCVRAGRHVITTKPAELDPVALLEVMTEARDLGRVVHFNSPSPVPTPDLALIEQWRAEHDLGRPVGARADTWCRIKERADGGWYDDPVSCPVAPILRIGIYAINDLVHVLGEPEEVQVLSSHLVTGRPTPDNAQLGIRFRGGALACVFASFCVGDGQQYRNSLVLNFEGGTVYRDVGPSDAGVRGRLALVLPGGQASPSVVRAEVKAVSGDYQWEVFHRAVLGEEVGEQVSPEQVATGIRVISAMALAERSGGVAKVGPA